VSRYRQDGFVLLEVIVAAAVLAVGLFAIIDALGRCVAAARAVQNSTIAETLLANQSFIFRVERALDELPQEGVFEDYPGFWWSRTFEPTDTEGLWQQTITVYWRERGRVLSESVVEYRYLPQKQR
jgi:prepilin-type N-terminal cleavage/methylation domain-containing protein